MKLKSQAGSFNNSDTKTRTVIKCFCCIAAETAQRKVILVTFSRDTFVKLCFSCKWLKHCVVIYSASPAQANAENEEESKLLHSEIWATLFRGGFMTGKLQRSLSGHHVSQIVIQ